MESFSAAFSGGPIEAASGFFSPDKRSWIFRCF